MVRTTEKPRAVEYRPACFESLEDRRLFAVSLNAAGFTVVTPAYDSKVIYVSTSSGSDSNNGLSSSKPVKTLDKAQSLVRSGMPDQILLKRGDIWNGGFGYWKKSGRSASEPMVIGTYGSGNRPEIRSGTAMALCIGSVAAKVVNNLTIQGLRVYANGRDPAAGGSVSSTNPVGIAIISATNNILIEDCKVEKYQANVNMVPVYGAPGGVTLRRNILIDAYSKNMGGHGLYADGVRGLNLVENVFDHNGWLASGAVKPNVNSHNAYVTATTSGLVATGNVFSDAGSHGLQARPGGVIEKNLFINNPIHLSYGIVNGNGANARGVSGRIEKNVFIGGRDIAGQGRGIAIEMGNIKAGTGTAVRDNVITSYTQGQLWAIQLGYGTGTNQNNGVGVNDLRIERNIVHKWYKGMYVQQGLAKNVSGFKHLGNVTLSANKFMEITSTVFINATQINIDNRTENTRSGYPAPDRSVASYMGSATGGTRSTNDFLVRARNRSLAVWDSVVSTKPVINHIRGGFGLAGI